MRTRTSSDIETRVQQVLNDVLYISDARISVAGRVIDLEGTAPSFRHKRAAGELACILTGATRVVNRLRVKRPTRREATPKGAHRKGSIWDEPRIKAMLEEPLGAPVSLTDEEADAIAKEAFGKRPDLPPGEEYVRQVRNVWAGLLKKRNG